jgi:hypothetical protein
MKGSDELEPYLCRVAAILPHRQFEQLLEHFAERLAEWDRGYVLMLRDQLLSKAAQNPQVALMIEVLDGHLALRDIQGDHGV